MHAAVWLAGSPPCHEIVPYCTERALRYSRLYLIPAGPNLIAENCVQSPKDTRLREVIDLVHIIIPRAKRFPFQLRSYYTGQNAILI